MHAAKRAGTKIMGIGGPVPVWFLERTIVALPDVEGGLHPFNQERLFFTDGRFPPILGRGLLRRMNARLSVDFVDEEGFLEIG